MPPFAMCLVGFSNTAKHLLKVLGREKTEVIGNEGNLFETEEAQEGTNHKLPALYITHVGKDGHVCRCPVCQPDVKEALKQKAIAEVKRTKGADLKQGVINSMTAGFVKQYEAAAKAEAVRKAELKAVTKVERASKQLAESM